MIQVPKFEFLFELRAVIDGANAFRAIAPLDFD